MWCSKINTQWCFYAYHVQQGWDDNIVVVKEGKIGEIFICQELRKQYAQQWAITITMKLVNRNITYQTLNDTIV